MTDKKNWSLYPVVYCVYHSLCVLPIEQEACFICKGPDGASAVMKMTSASQESMWAALEKADVEK